MTATGIPVVAITGGISSIALVFGIGFYAVTAVAALRFILLIFISLLIASSAVGLALPLLTTVIVFSLVNWTLLGLNYDE